MRQRQPPVRWIAGLLGALALLAVLAAAVWVPRALRVHRIERDELRWSAPPDAPPAPPAGIDGLVETHWTLADATRQRAFYAPGTSGCVLVVVHGSPGTALGMLPQARALARRGHGVLLVDLPGYGGSEGARTWGAAARASLRAAVDFAAAQPGVRAIAGYGYSMGTSVLAQAAADDARIGTIVLLAPFTDFASQRAAQHRSRVPGMGAVAVLSARWLGLAVDELDTSRALRRLGDRPLLLVAGDADRAVPLAMVRRLKALAENAELWVLPGAGHVDVAQTTDDAFLHHVHAFLLRNLGDTVSP
ncbi:MAG: hypothetical protein DCC71_05230 [Proteobacteria bacterium]|nr:MAG: hypothetical protein DCC71_05230 [Pseudomonadota bacterium]